ncbi:unnamed protein product [Nippostrongylus brasiliensis]|uniref:G_PROTEIN_RECEP_F1_2 domain-containing protein n=1 Tax=Nippostrongylus brasiliensis TaxID=27835 RepID=A0A0N4XYH6_NIPBR|nr:unnamed protein product [Nippostrongylus brasiliensis]
MFQYELDCKVMEGMASSTVLNAILVVCDLSSLIATPLLIFLTIRIWKTKLMHFNTRLLLCLHTVFLLVHVVGRAVLHTMDLYMYHSLFKNGCEILRTKEECFFLRLPYNVSTVMCSCSAVFIAIERLTATLHTRNYEKGFKKVGTNLLCIYALLLPVILWCKKKDVRNQIKHIVHQNVNTNYNQVFNVLRSQWDAPPENRVPSPKPKARLTCS